MKTLAACVTSKSADIAAKMLYGVCYEAGVDCMVVCNGCAPPTDKEFCAMFLPVNVGCPGGTNTAFKAAKEGGYDYLLRIDDDAEVLTPDWLGRCLKVMERDPKCGLIGSKILQPDKNHCGHCNCRVTREGFVLRSGLMREAPVVCKTDYASFITGVFMFFRMDAVKDVGDMDLLFTPSQFDDVDYCMQMWAKGWHVVYDGGIEVFHNSGAPVADARRDMISNAHGNVLNMKYGGNFLLHAEKLEESIDKMGREIKEGAK